MFGLGLLLGLSCSIVWKTGKYRKYVINVFCLCYVGSVSHRLGETNRNKFKNEKVPIDILRN